MINCETVDGIERVKRYRALDQPTLIRGVLLLCISVALNAQTPATPSSKDDATPLSYELVSIHKSKPDAQGYDLGRTPEGIDARAINLRELLSEAYGFTFGEMLKDQIVGLPDWAHSQRFDIRAKVDDSNVARLKAIRDAETMAVFVNSMVQRKPTPETQMLQHLMEEYFHLKIHYEQRVMSTYDLKVAKGGVRMKVAQPKDPEHGSVGFSKGKLTGENVPPDFITLLLPLEVGRPVVNRTNLPGRYDFEMTFASEAGMKAPVAVEETGPSIFTALDEQLGLKLVPAKEPVWIIVVDHVEMPAND